jgi:hypothetical protein
MRVRPLEPEDGAALRSLFSRYPHHDYRAYPAMPADAGARALVEDFAPGREGLVAAGVWTGEAMVAAGLLEVLSWDSAHFGLRMGRIGPLVAAPGDGAAAAIGALLDWLLERAQAARLDHLAVRVDGADIPTVQALEARGFRLMDCLLSYLHDFRRPAPAVKLLGTIRDYRASDEEAVIEIAERMLGTYAGGRFAFDPWLSRDAVRRFYVEWARNACAGRMADRIIVGERHGRLVAFLAYRRQPRPFRSLGVRIAGHGISAVLPEGTGLYPGLIAWGILTERGTYEAAEFETSVHNVLPQRVFQRLGFQLARTAYALHRGRP